MNVRLFLCMCVVKHEMTFEVAAELLGVCIDVKTTVKISVTKRFFFSILPASNESLPTADAHIQRGGRQFHIISLFSFFFCFCTNHS